jgi:predicted metalloprotease
LFEERQKVKNHDLAASTAEQIAAGIYAAATDGKPQLRYLLGEDAKQAFALCQQVGDDAFMAGMRQRMFG